MTESEQPTFTPDNTVSGEAITIKPGTAEWNLIVSARAAHDDFTRSDAAKDALFHLCELVGPSLPASLRMAWKQGDVERTFARSEHIEGLRWLCAAGVAPVLLGQLLMALEELDRGATMDVLKPPVGKGKGPKSSLQQLWWKAIAVQAADEATKLEPTVEGKDAVLRPLGFRRSTIETYRKTVANGPSEFRDPVGYFLRFGETAPGDILAIARRNLPTAK